ncbi:putative holin-like toxin [Streptococcus downei]|nr:putative holin-like toxin [Streptococcus downei]
MSTFEALTLIFVAGNFIINLMRIVLELLKWTKK